MPPSPQIFVITLASPAGRRSGCGWTMGRAARVSLHTFSPLIAKTVLCQDATNHQPLPFVVPGTPASDGRPHTSRTPEGAFACVKNAHLIQPVNYVKHRQDVHRREILVWKGRVNLFVMFVKMAIILIMVFVSHVHQFLMLHTTLLTFARQIVIVVSRVVALRASN